MKPGRLRFTATIAAAVNNISLAAVGVADVSQTMTAAAGTGLGTGPVEGTVSIVCSGAEPTCRFLVKGTGGDGNGIIESVQGPTAAGTVRTINAFRTVTSVTPSVATASITVGWAATGFATRTYPIDILNQNFLGSYVVEYAAASTGTVQPQYTLSPLLSRRGSPDLLKPRNANWFGTEFDIIHPLIDGSLFTDFNASGAALTVSQTAAVNLPAGCTGIRMVATTTIVGTIDMHFVFPGPYRTG